MSVAHGSLTACEDEDPRPISFLPPFRHFDAMKSGFAKQTNHILLTNPLRMLGHARERILPSPFSIFHVAIGLPFRDITVHRAVLWSDVGVQHDSPFHNRKNLSKMTDRIGQMIEDSHMMEDVAGQVRLLGDSFFDIPHKDFRRRSVCRASDDGLDHVFDSAVRREHSPSQSGECHGVDSLETTHLQYDKVSEREATVKFNDTAVGNPLRRSALADRPRLPKSPAECVKDVTTPGKKVVEPTQILILQRLEKIRLKTTVTMAAV